MRILTRYILFDLLKVFFLTLFCMTAFLFVILVSKLAVDEGLGFLPILRALPYIFPQAMQFAVPGTMLLATVAVYGRVAASNEIVAVKSMGISPLTLVWPTLLFATMVSFGAVVLNDVAVSWGRGGVERVLLESLEEIAYGRLRTSQSYSHNKFKVSVKRVVGHQLIQPTLHIFDDNHEISKTIHADTAEIRSDLKKKLLQIKFTNAELDSHGKGWDGHIPGEHEESISLENFGGQRTGKRSTSQYSLSEIGPSKAEQVVLIDQLQQKMAAEAGLALMSGRMFALSQENWESNQTALRIAHRKLHRLNTEPHRRWANGFSCLCFVLIGAPMAIRLRHGEIWGSFFACFLPILLVYYPMLAGCLDLAKDGVLPPQAVWLGNVVLAFWGIWLLRRVVRL